jgi:hypothetical protein
MNTVEHRRLADGLRQPSIACCFLRFRTIPSVWDREALSTPGSTLPAAGHAPALPRSTALVLTVPFRLSKWSHVKRCDS